MLPRRWQGFLGYGRRCPCGEPLGAALDACQSGFGQGPTLSSPFGRPIPVILFIPREIYVLAPCPIFPSKPAKLDLESREKRAEADCGTRNNGLRNTAFA